MDLQWWQWVVAAVCTLGLSPAPWITALLMRRLMPLGAHLERVADLKEAHKIEVKHQEDRHARELGAKDTTIASLTADRAEERTATRLERDRADTAVAKLGALTEQFGRVTVDMLTAGERDRDQQR